MSVAPQASNQSAPLVGVLSLQGDFADHEAALAACGLRTRQIRRASQLREIDALVLPGGESTTMLKLLTASPLKYGVVKVMVKPSVSWLEKVTGWTCSGTDFAV